MTTASWPGWPQPADPAKQEPIKKCKKVNKQLTNNSKQIGTYLSYISENLKTPGQNQFDGIFLGITKVVRR